MLDDIEKVNLLADIDTKRWKEYDKKLYEWLQAKRKSFLSPQDIDDMKRRALGQFGNELVAKLLSEPLVKAEVELKDRMGLEAIEFVRAKTMWIQGFLMGYDYGREGKLLGRDRKEK